MVWDAVAPFGADTLVTAIVPMLAVVVAGSVRAARGIAGAKPLLVGADLGIAALAGATWALANPRFVEVPGWLFAATSRQRSRRPCAALLLPEHGRGGRAGGPVVGPAGGDRVLDAPRSATTSGR